ncbi:DUF4345 domain-containing protein [Haliscomenobacter hydrossis]|uniref:DUF4345 domain-containing protein n=1 Tax=Haliscomenobacter hydrossis (strain ATCC 27775 / DSM 1100 / LMG 10767 / O) TaxID=760192 RepID=F4L4S7_HALH1|nr:DUF4345 domain-containing protein [Haliscomenobacter hydrossis]AEE53025.1 hypothetical protein Halhy_5199 [Haliscomenobacter hydrossis DSM 1100]
MIKRETVLRFVTIFIIALNALGVLMISLQAMVNPQSVMDLVGVKLTNTDAYSSIRGVYGGIGLLIFIQLVYLAIKNPKQGLALVALFGGLYAFSRIMTIFMEGELGAFGQQWLIIEATLCLLALTVLALRLRSDKKSVLG